MEKPRRILLIRPSALGDVCRSVPVLVSLKARYPEAEIDWLVQDTFAPAVSAHPALSRVAPFPRSKVALGRVWRPGAQRMLLSFLGTLERARYDLVIDCQGLSRSGIFAWWTRAPRRVGYSNAQELAWLAYNERHRVPRRIHAVDRMLTLIEAAGVPPVRDMRLYASDSDRASARALLPPSASAARYAVIAPTSRWPGKRWPAERFVQVARTLLEEGSLAHLLIVGGPHERDQCGPLTSLAASDRRVIDLVGKTPIGVLMALIEGAAIVIANDSAPLHMAVGFDRPLVGLFGPTRIDLVGPYGRERDVIQAASPGPRNQHKNETTGRAAMEAIRTETVIDAALERLERTT